MGSTTVWSSQASEKRKGLLKSITAPWLDTHICMLQQFFHFSVTLSCVSVFLIIFGIDNLIFLGFRDGRQKKLAEHCLAEIQTPSKWNFSFFYLNSSFLCCLWLFLHFEFEQKFILCYHCKLVFGVKCSLCSCCNVSTITVLILWNFFSMALSGLA